MPKWNPDFDQISLNTVDGRKIAYLQIKYEQGVLEIEYIAVHEDFRRMHLGFELMRLVLQQYPEVEVITVSNLIETNFKVKQAYLAQGYSIEDAIRETPAYKIRARLGFSEIVPGSIAPPHNDGFQVRKPSHPNSEP